jgi:hypothetical protein
MSLRTNAAIAAACTSWVSISVASSTAQAAPSPTCASAYEDTQLHRRSGKLIEAREAALSCSRPSCPDVARQDCEVWAAEIQREIPSVVVVALVESYVDERNARVVVDGVERAEGASGRAFEVNPGEHVFRIERPGYEPIERAIVVLQGERDRILRFSLHALASAAPAPTSAPSSPAPEILRPRVRATYMPAIVAGGAAAAAFGVSAWLGLTGRSDLSSLRTTCAPACTDDQVDPVRRKLIASDIVLGVGVAAAVVSGYLFVRPPPWGPAAAVRIGVAPTLADVSVSIAGAL